MVLALVQAIINGIGALGRLISRLPSSPFYNLTSIIGENPYIDAVLWIIPIGQALSLLQAWCLAILMYYIVLIPLRWAKALT